MLVPTVKGQKHKSIVIGESVRAATPNVHGDNVRQRITARLSEKIDSLPKARKEKVLAVRRKLEAGKYAIKERLNVATDRLIENLIITRMEESETKITT
jgi:hypothetical protein